MPKTQAPSRQVGAMLESRSLVSETKHDASLKIQAGSIVESGAGFEKTDVAVVEVVDHLKPQLLSSKSRRKEIVASFLFAGLGTIRNEVEVALPAAKQVPKPSASVGFANVGGLRSIRSQIQSMPSLVQLAAKIVWPVASLNRAGITSRSSGLASPAA